MSAPIILYENVFGLATPTATDTATGYAAANIADRRSYTYWKSASTGTKYLTVNAGTSYTVTLANTKLSAQSGRAFLDLAGVDLSSHIGKKVTVTDSGGKTLVGWVKAAGAGASYGGEQLINREFTYDALDWTGVNGTLASVAGGESGNCLEITRVSDTFQNAKMSLASGAQGALWRLTVYVKSGSSGNETALAGIYYDGESSWVYTSTTSSGSWVQIQTYLVIPLGVQIGGVFFQKQSATAGTMLFDTASLTQMLTPSSQGVTIVSTRGGTTYSWTSEESGFNRNDSSGYTVTIAPAADAVALVSHNLWSSGIALSVESSDDNATWTERKAAAVPSSDRPYCATFTQAAARYWRLKLASGSATPEIGEAVLGAVLTFPKSPDRPVTPSIETVEAETVIGKTGHILGTIRRHVKVMATPIWSNLSASWVSGDFRTFWDKHVKYLYPFVWAWDLTNYPADVYWMAPKDPATWQAPMGVATYVNQLSLPMTGIMED